MRAGYTEVRVITSYATIGGVTRVHTHVDVEVGMTTSCTGIRMRDLAEN